MKRYVLILGLGAVLMAAEAFGEVQDFDHFSVDVPEGWTAEQQGATVVLKAVSSDASLSVAQARRGEATLEEIAKKLFEQLGGVDLEKDEDGDFLFVYRDTAGVESCVYVIDGDKGTYLVLATSGHEQPGGEMLDKIIDSMKFRVPEADEDDKKEEDEDEDEEFDEED